MAKRQQTFEEAMSDKYGDFVVIDEENQGTQVKSISTGALSLDVSLGCGGIPLRRFTEIYGDEGSGKTTTCLSIAKNMMISGNKVLYIDPEQALDFAYARAIMGEFDKSMFVLVQPETAEQAMDIAEAGIQSKEFGGIFLDSIGSMLPEKEREKELKDATMGQLSQLMTKFSHRNAFAVRRSDVAFVGVNQVRDKFNAYVPTFNTPGGHSWKHLLSVRIQLARATDIEQNKEKIGINSRFTIKKNKLAPPFRSFTIPIMFGKGIDYYRDVVQFSEMLGVLERRGPYYFFESETVGKGVVNSMEFLQNSPDTLDKVVKMCYNVINQVRETKENEEDE